MAAASLTFSAACSRLAFLSLPEDSWMRAILRGFLSTGLGTSDDMVRMVEARRGEKVVLMRGFGLDFTNGREQEKKVRRRERRMATYEVVGGDATATAINGW